MIGARSASFSSHANHEKRLSPPCYPWETLGFVFWVSSPTSLCSQPATHLWLAVNFVAMSTWPSSTWQDTILRWPSPPVGSGASLQTHRALSHTLETQTCAEIPLKWRKVMTQRGYQPGEHLAGTWDREMGKGRCFWHLPGGRRLFSEVTDTYSCFRDV